MALAKLFFFFFKKKKKSSPKLVKTLTKIQTQRTASKLCETRATTAIRVSWNSSHHLNQRKSGRTTGRREGGDGGSWCTRVLFSVFRSRASFELLAERQRKTFLRPFLRLWCSQALAIYNLSNWIQRRELRSQFCRTRPVLLTFRHRVRRSKSSYCRFSHCIFINISLPKKCR